MIDPFALIARKICNGCEDEVQPCVLALTQLYIHSLVCKRRMIGGQEGLFPNSRNENEVISCKLENVLKRDGLEEHKLLSCITQATSRMLKEIDLRTYDN